MNLNAQDFFLKKNIFSPDIQRPLKRNARKIVMYAIFLSIAIYSELLTNTVYAQEGAPGIAQSIVITDKNLQDGDIISSSSKGYSQSKVPYDSSMFGVYTANPFLYIENLTLKGRKAVVNNGQVYVRVSTKNGPIQVGDPITSSDSLGVGQKADKSGYILGNAVESFTNSNPKASGKILVAVDIRPSYARQDARYNLLEALRQGISSPFLTPLTSLRYLLAAIVAGGTFILAFVSVGRIARAGIEAMGRNPLATRTIQLGMVFNVVLTMGIMIVGLGIAYLILIL